MNLYVKKIIYIVWHEDSQNLRENFNSLTFNVSKGEKNSIFSMSNKANFMDIGVRKKL